MYCNIGMIYLYVLEGWGVLYCITLIYFYLYHIFLSISYIPNYIIYLYLYCITLIYLYDGFPYISITLIYFYF